MTQEIDNSMDIIDSRDVIARIDDLENDLDTLIADIQDAKDEETDVEQEANIQSAIKTLADWLGTDNLSAIRKLSNDDQLNFENLTEYMNSDEARELEALKTLADDAKGHASDWTYGEALIRETYFEEYAQDLAADLYGKEISDAKWPFDCIDWEKAAEELKQDYTTIDFDGIDYLIR